MSNIYYKDQELCIGNDCRYLPKNGPISFLPNLRINKNNIILCTSSCICIVILFFILFSFIKLNNPKPVSAAQLLESIETPNTLII